MRNSQLKRVYGLLNYCDDNTQVEVYVTRAGGFDYIINIAIGDHSTLQRDSYHILYLIEDPLTMGQSLSEFMEEVEQSIICRKIAIEKEEL